MSDRPYLDLAVLGLIIAMVFLLILPWRSRSRSALPWGIAAALLAIGSFVTFVNVFAWSARFGYDSFPWIEKAALVQCALSLYFTRIAYRRGRAPVPTTPPTTGE